MLLHLANGGLGGTIRLWISLHRLFGNDFDFGQATGNQRLQLQNRRLVVRFQDQPLVPKLNQKA